MNFPNSHLALLVISSLCGSLWAETAKPTKFLNIDAAPVAIRTRNADAVFLHFNQVVSSLEGAGRKPLSIRIESSMNQLGLIANPEQADKLHFFQMALLGKLMAYPGEIHSISILGVDGFDDSWIKTLLSREDISFINLTDLDSVSSNAFSELSIEDSNIHVVICRCKGIHEGTLQNFVPAKRLQMFQERAR